MTRQFWGLFTVAVLFSACDLVVDNDFIVVEGGLALHPGALPFGVAADETVPEGAAEAGVSWWNETLGREVLFVGEPAQVTVTVGYVPPNSDELDGSTALGRTHIDYARDGEVLGAEVTVSSDFAYDEDTLLQVMRHELGHAAFGLADDPGPPETVDLRSIMASPMDPLGTLTAHDRNIIEPYLPCVTP